MDSEKLLEWVNEQKAFAEARRKECETSKADYLVEYYKGMFYGFVAVEDKIQRMIKNLW